MTTNYVNALARHYLDEITRLQLIIGSLKGENEDLRTELAKYQEENENANDA